MLTEMTGILQRVRRAWRWWTERFPVDAPGALLVVLGLIAVVGYGVGRQDRVLLVVGAVALVGVFACTLAVIVGALAIWMRKPPSAEPPLLVECGHSFETGFSIARPWWNPLVDVDWTWASPPAEVRLERSWSRATERVVVARRGEHDGIVRQVVVADVFGLCSVSFPVASARRVRATPTAGALKQMHVVQGMAGGDALSHPTGPATGDRYDMRHYSAGDPIRFVLWKVFAKSRTLVIRTPENAISPVQQTVAYLVSGPGDEPAAGAARVAVEAGSLGADWVLGADGATEGVSQRSQAMEVLVRSASVPEHQGGAGLGRFLVTVNRGGVRRAVVFCPARPGPWLEAVLAAARSGAGGVPLDFLVCADGIDATPPARWWSRVLFQPATSASGVPRATERELAQVVRALAATGAEVKIVDRVAGRVHLAGHVLRGSAR